MTWVFNEILNDLSILSHIFMANMLVVDMNWAQNWEIFKIQNWANFQNWEILAGPARITESRRQLRSSPAAFPKI